MMSLNNEQEVNVPHQKEVTAGMQGSATPNKDVGLPGKEASSGTNEKTAGKQTGPTTKSSGKKKSLGKVKSTTKTKSPSAPAVEGAFGVVLKDGSYECHLSVRGHRCGAHMKNERPNIRSHLSKKHKEDSAYKKDQKLGSWPCTWQECIHRGNIYLNFNSLVGHVRSVHGMTGSSKRLKINSSQLQRKILEKQRAVKRAAEREGIANSAGTDGSQRTSVA